MKASNLHKLLIVLTVVLLAVAGVYFFVPAKKKAPVVVVNSNQNTNTAVVSNGTPELKTYSNPELGVEFKYPASWTGGSDHVGSDPGNEDGFWRDMTGRVYKSGPGTNLFITVKKSNLSLLKFKGNLGYPLDDNGKETTIAGLSAFAYETPLHYTGPSSPESAWQTQDHLLVKSGNKYFYIELIESAPDEASAKTLVKEREIVISSLKLY